MFIQGTKILLNLLLMVLIISPLLLLVYTTFYSYRLFIILLSKIIRRDLVEIVRERDAVFTSDNFTKRPDSTTLVHMKIEGDVELEDLRMFIRERFQINFQSVDLSKNDNAYSTLTHYFARWGGFMFRKLEKDFNIENHARELSKEDSMSGVTESDFYNIRRQLLLEPYKNGTSPWELVLIRHYENPENAYDLNEQTKTVGANSIVIARFHHGLVDGFSLLRMFMAFCAKNKQPMPLVMSQKLTAIQNLKVFGAAYTLAPSSALSQIPTVHPENIFHPHNAQLKGSRHPVDCTVPVSLVKQIVRETRTSFSAVLLAALTGGIRNHLIAIKKPVPKTIDLSLPFPWPGHPSRIGNYFTFAVFQLPVGLSCPSQRLQDVQRKFLGLKNSAVPAFNYINVSIAGMLPILIMDLILKSGASSILMSNIPGPQEQADAFDKPMMQNLFEGGYGKGPLGMGVTMLSYNGTLTISINPDEGIIPSKDEALQLLRSISHEFDHLNLQSIV